MSDAIQIGPLTIDLASYRLQRNGEQIRLTPTEWALLRELIHHPNQVLTHRMLLQRVWGDEYATEYDYVHTYISRLRRKLEQDPSDPEFILTEVGIGYRFNYELQRHSTTPDNTDPADDILRHEPVLTRKRFINPLPQNVSDRYVGREHEREQLRSLLLDNSRLISIYGRAGVGKTALACKVLSDLQNTNAFDGMVFLSATSTGITLGRILSDFDRLLNDDTSTIEQSQTVYRVTHLLDRLNSGNYILLLDNLEYVQHPETNEFTDRDLETFFNVALEQGSSLRILITSRYPLHLPRTIKIWERMVSLETGLNTEDGIQLLRQSDQDGNAGLRDAPDENLRLFVERTQGHPRALEAIIGILMESPLITPEELLIDQTQLAHELDDMFVRGAIDRLGDDALTVMEFTALFDRAVPLRLFERFAQPNLKTQSIKAILNRLIRAYFLTYSPDNQTISMHPIDREYCYSRIPANTRREYHQQIAALYMEETASELTPHNITDLSAQLSAFHHMVEGGQYDMAAKHILELDHAYLSIWGSYAELAERYARIVEQLSDPALTRQMLLRHGEALRRIGHLNDAIAHLNHAQQLAREADDSHDVAVALSSIGWTYYDTGQFTQAIAAWQTARAIFKTLDDHYGEADLLGGMGWVSYLMGSYDEALDYIQTAFRMFGEIGNQLYRIGMNIGDLGMIHTAQGDYTQAIKNLQESLSIADVTHSNSEKSYKGGYLAVAYLLAGDLEQAEAAAREAVRYDVPANRHFVYAVHGITLARLSKTEEAITAFQTAIEHADHVLRFTSGLYNARYSRALALAGLALLNDTDLSPALEDYGKALAMCATGGVVQLNHNLLKALPQHKNSAMTAPLYKLLNA